MKLVALILLVGIGLIAPGESGTLSVTSLEDNGPGSLRDAIASAIAGDTITFDLPLPATILLYSGELLIDKDLVISGPDPDQLIVTAEGSGFRIFEVTAGAANVTISGITITGGVVEAPVPTDGGACLITVGAQLQSASV